MYGWSEPEADPITIAELGGAPTIDVHGFDAHSAIFEVSAFCSRMFALREPVVKVIHGHGKGILRQALQKWAKQHKYRAQDSSLPHEAGAVLYIQTKS